MVAKFQRTTSAIEGRNGYLSRLHHSGRGLSEKDLQVLSVIHNFDLHRADGSTAAQRFFGRTFPPLFSWVFGQMGDLPADRLLIILGGSEVLRAAQFALGVDFVQSDRPLGATEA